MTAHNDTVIIIKNNTNHKLDNFKTDFLQATAVEIKDWFGFLVILSI